MERPKGLSKRPIARLSVNYTTSFELVESKLEKDGTRAKPGAAAGGMAAEDMNKNKKYNEGVEITTDYVYNGVGELKLTTDDMGNETVMTYDFAGRMTGVENGDSGLLEYIFDDAGNMRPETRRVEQ